MKMTEWYDVNRWAQENLGVAVNRAPTQLYGDCTVLDWKRFVTRYAPDSPLARHTGLLQRELGDGYGILGRAYQMAGAGMIADIMPKPVDRLASDAAPLSATVDPQVFSSVMFVVIRKMVADLEQFIRDRREETRAWSLEATGLEPVTESFASCYPDRVRVGDWGRFLRWAGIEAPPFLVRFLGFACAAYISVRGVRRPYYVGIPSGKDYQDKESFLNDWTPYETGSTQGETMYALLASVDFDALRIQVLAALRQYRGELDRYFDSEKGDG